MKRKIIVSVMTLIMMLTIITGCGEKGNTNTTENKVDNTTYKNTIEEQVVEGLTFSKAKVEYKNNETTIEVTLSNQTNEAIKVETIKMHLKDKNDNELFEFVVTNEKKIEAGKTQTVTGSYAGDLSETTKIEYEVVKK